MPPFVFLSDEDVLIELIEASCLAPELAGLLGAAPTLVAITIGVVTAAKIQQQVRTQVSTTTPLVAEFLERTSDALAAQHFTRIADLLVTPQRDLRPFRRPRIVTGHRGPTWCPVTYDPAWPMPTALLTPDVPRVAVDVTAQLVERLNGLRDRASATGTAEEIRLHQISESVALIAHAKIHLGLWGDGPLAAVFEALAETSAREFSDRAVGIIRSMSS